MNGKTKGLSILATNKSSEMAKEITVKNGDRERVANGVAEATQKEDIVVGGTNDGVIDVDFGTGEDTKRPVELGDKLETAGRVR